jgi:GDP-L-fucose synthase
LRKIHEAKAAGRRTVEIWGTGTPRREFLHVDDLAEACLFLLSHYDRPEIVNVGWGQDVSIAELAHTIAGVVGFTGTFVFDSSKPDGTPRKLLDTSRLTTLGWRPSISLESGIRSTYEWYLQQLAGGASLEKG